MTAETALRTDRSGNSPERSVLHFENLMGADGRTYSSTDFDSSPTLVLVVVGNGCPSVKAYGDELRRIDRKMRPLGVQVIAVNSNNEALSPPDTLSEMAEVARARSWEFPYLKDRAGALARTIGASTTPHAFVFDSNRTLCYRGRITDSRDPVRATSTDLLDAVADVNAHRAVQVPATQPLGCSIVW